ncbi:MAG TPA: hypothetical protein ENH94_06075 [Phycisphaerales bacterium]|nr:hypothetical protein [Phycisphaerales bacterium]
MTTERVSINRVDKRRAEMPSRYRKLYDRVMSGVASPREAIRMQCLECWGYVKAETATCDNYACPLFAYRPYQKPLKSPAEGLGGSNTHENQSREV